MRGLAFEEALRLYRAALELGSVARRRPPGRTQLDLGRACSLAGDLDSALTAAVAAAGEARSRADELLAQAALVMEPVPDPGVCAVLTQLCEEAVASTRSRLGDGGGAAGAAAGPAQPPRVLRRRPRADPERGRAGPRPRPTAGDDTALVAALRARHDACPAADGRPVRLELADEMLAVAERTATIHRDVGRLWRIDSLIENGGMTRAADELGPLTAAVDRVGGPVSGWHRDRVTACVAQARAVSPTRGRRPGAATSGCG